MNPVRVTRQSGPSNTGVRESALAHLANGVRHEGVADER